MTLLARAGNNEAGGALAGRLMSRAAGAHRADGQDQPGEHGQRGEYRGQHVPQEHGGGDGGEERGQVEDDVVHRRDEPPVHHVEPGDRHAARERHREQEVDYRGRVSAAVESDGLEHAAVVGDQQQGAVLGLEGLLRAFEACRRASALPGIGVLALRH